jgi:hypothetical protein
VAEARQVPDLVDHTVALMRVPVPATTQERTIAVVKGTNLFMILSLLS